MSSDGPGADVMPGVVPRAGRWRRPSTFAWPAAILAGVAVTGALLVVSFAGHGPAPTVVLSVPYWSLDHGTATVEAQPSQFSEVSPWIYGLDHNGQIVTQYGSDLASDVSADLERLRNTNVRIVPSLANMTDGAWSYGWVGAMLRDPGRMKQHVADIVQLVQREGYAGIDIDYEELRAGDRSAFSTFVVQLADALHAKGKVLSVAVFAKTTDEGTDQRNVAQDYAVIGRAADQVRVMAYDYHWPTSAPGPVAPIDWVRNVVRYATGEIERSKIILGIPLYGYDWSGGQGRPVAWLDAMRLCQQYGVDPQYDQANQAPWFSYQDTAGQRHTVWFENWASTEAKLEMARGSGVTGIYMWMFGHEDPATWTTLRETMLDGRDAANPSSKGI